MPAYWILKTEPSTYSYADLEREGRAVWDGVKNNLALKHIRAMKRGDRTLVCHSGKEKAAVGIARVVSDPYPDPKQRDPRLVVVDLEASEPLPQAVTLARIKAEPAFARLPLVRMPRLSVMPCEPELWKRILTLAGK